MTRYATIDLGTNTALLFIGDWDGERLTTIVDHAEITRLGKGVAQRGALDPEVARNTLETLRQYATLIKDHQATGLACIGTASLRDASDGDAFRQLASQALGAPLEVISGDDEARLVARAVQGAFPSSAQRVAFDIGGGSTELVLQEGAQIIGRRSYPIGSVKLFERYLKSDPPGTAELAMLRQGAQDALAELPFSPPPMHSPEQLIGIAGTVTTLCAVVKQVAPYDPAKIHGSTLTAAAVEALFSQLAAMPLSQRLLVPGLSPGRADVILAGAAVFLEVLARLNAQSMTVSDHGIRHGLFWERFVDTKKQG